MKNLTVGRKNHHILLDLNEGDLVKIENGGTHSSRKITLMKVVNSNENYINMYNKVEKIRLNDYVYDIINNANTGDIIEVENLEDKNSNEVIRLIKLDKQEDKIKIERTTLEKILGGKFEIVED